MLSTGITKSLSMVVNGYKESITVSMFENEFNPDQLSVSIDYFHLLDMGWAKNTNLSTYTSSLGFMEEPLASTREDIFLRALFKELNDYVAFCETDYSYSENGMLIYNYNQETLQKLKRFIKNCPEFKTLEEKAE